MKPVDSDASISAGTPASPGEAAAPTPAAPVDPSAFHDPYAAWKVTDFRRYFSGNILAQLGMQMQSSAVGWEVYERTHDKMALALIGLVQVLPVIILALPAGTLIDRFDRRKIILAALTCLVLCSLGLAGVSLRLGPIGMIYVLLLFSGAAKAFLQPAKAAFLPQIVPRERFSNAVTWNGGGFQLASIVGPAVAGLVIALLTRPAVVYLLDATFTLTYVVLLLRIPSRPVAKSKEPVSVQTLLAGMGFVWRTKIVLAAITIDLFAVLLGGATTLLPVFATDVLEVGPVGFGWLRAAPGLGALLMSFVLAYRPPLKHAGRNLLVSVAGFGVATIVFGLTRDYWLSLLMLFLTGAFDMVSVVIRHTLVQLQTPDAMRGRVSAVNSIFIGASNELGGFESGVVADLFDRPGDLAFGPTVSVVSGGIGTLIVVGLTPLLWPEVRTFDGTADPHKAGAAS